METITVEVNGQRRSQEIDERTLLLYFLREDLGLTGAHEGCLEARCGCCAVLVDGNSVKSCNVLALQVDGCQVITAEGLAPASAPGLPTHWVDEVNSDAPDGEPVLSPLQSAFRRHGAVQCGFCTPGMLAVLTDYLSDAVSPVEEDIRKAIRGNLCRCTGYQKIIDAAMDVASGPGRRSPVVD